ncbi:MAG: nuclear transport factor 2 family protein [Candidatus Krumholzibacteriia bacterium]
MTKLAWLLPLLALTLAGPVRGEPVDLRPELMQADRDFCTAVAAGGLAAWLDHLAPDAVRLPSLGSTTPVQGKAAIAASDRPLFADPTRRLLWEPTSAAAFADGRSGCTTGTYRYVQLDQAGAEVAVLGQGRYLTWWVLDASGHWRVLLDTGEADPAPAAHD